MSLLAGPSTGLDPDAYAPWPAYNLPVLSHAFAQTSGVILVLGAPTPHALSPILRSATFARSLVLLVTHAPPPRSALLSAIASTGSHAAIRVLRLRAPLAPGVPAFALTLLDVLDAAAAVAREWRVAPDPECILQLAQDPTGGAAFCISEQLPDYIPFPHLAPRTSSPLSTLAASNTASLIASASLVSRRARADSKTLFGRSMDDDTRPFDALLSFLPPDQNDNAVLKHAVLITNLAAGFLAGPAYVATDETHHSDVHPVTVRDPSPAPHENKHRAFHWRSRSEPLPARATNGDRETGADSPPPPRHKRSFSLFRRSKSHANLRGSASVHGVGEEIPPMPTSMASAAPSPSPSPTPSTSTSTTGTTAHIVHVLPATYRSVLLVRALSAFLAAFSSGAGVRTPQDRPQAKAYVMSERAMSEVECVLVGALETPSEADRERRAGAGIATAAEEKRGAWVPAVVSVEDGHRAAGGKRGDLAGYERQRRQAEGVTSAGGGGLTFGLQFEGPVASGSDSPEKQGGMGTHTRASSSNSNGPGQSHGHTRRPSTSHGQGPRTSDPSFAERSLPLLLDPAATGMPGEKYQPREPPTAYAGGPLLSATPARASQSTNLNTTLSRPQPQKAPTPTLPSRHARAPSSNAGPPPSAYVYGTLPRAPAPIRTSVHSTRTSSRRRGGNAPLRVWETERGVVSGRRNADVASRLAPIPQSPHYATMRARALGVGTVLGKSSPDLRQAGLAGEKNAHGTGNEVRRKRWLLF